MEDMAKAETLDDIVWYIQANITITVTNIILLKLLKAKQRLEKESAETNIENGAVEDCSAEIRIDEKKINENDANIKEKEKNVRICYILL